MNYAWLLFSFNGRISRQTYWMFVLVSVVIVLFPAFFGFGFGTESGENFVDIMSLLLIWPTYAIQAKRWHDRDKSAWWVLINFIPLIGTIWALVENGFLPGTESENRFGPNPIVTARNET